MSDGSSDGNSNAHGQSDRKIHDPRSYDATAAADGDDAGTSSKSEDKSGQEGKDQPPPKKKQSLVARHPVGVVIAVVVLVILLVLGILYWLHARNFESTDDAFTDTHLVRMAPRISGRVSRVAVEDNQQVKAGQVLLEIDPRDYQAKLAQAQANLAQADAQIAQAQAQLVQTNAQVNVSQANVRQAQASALSSAAQANFAASDLARYHTLKSLNPSAVAQQQLDQSTSQAQSTAAQHTAALRQVEAGEAQVRATASQRASARAQIQAGLAQRMNALAAIRSAELDLSYTVVKAPEDGTVAQRTVALGDYVTAGTQIMAIVPLNTYVTANFKETQLALMRPGQLADIRVDACPQFKIHGHVDSIQRGSGQAFGILPPENATGNFVKVVQRVPVKILFDNPPRDCPLGPGLSVDPKVRVR
jgi:membrane fusion protein (multidrug efflux system)